MILDHPADLFKACRRISPINPDYANLPTRQGFNWFSCLGDARFGSLYLVVFRSVRRATAELGLLKEHDDRAFEAALEAGGLLRYFKGQMNQRRECLSFCLWERKEQAVTLPLVAPSTGLQAQVTAETYESYTLERYELTNDDTGDLAFKRFEGAPARAGADPSGVSV